MTDLLPIVTAAGMRGWEADAFGTGGISERVVLESAGRAVAHAIATRFPDGRVVGVAGRGNNGADTIVALRTLRALGREVCVVLPNGEGRMASLVHGWEVPVVETEAFDGAGVLVDGLLGTGATGAPREPLSGVIRAMNSARCPRVAVDGPSGVDLTTGAVPGEAVEADLTVTFGALKRGLLMHPGRRLAGRVLVAEVGFPPLPETAMSAGVITERWARSRLPLVPPDAHKGSRGLVGVVAGRKGFAGAAIMAGMGALRAGAGGVRVVTVDANRLAVQSAVPEAVFVDRESPELFDALRGTRAAVVGPGLGTDEDAHRLLASILDQYEGFMVLDADAITLIAHSPHLLNPELGARCVLTPHPGELARLLGVDIASVLADPFSAAGTVSRRFGCVVLAKGSPSIVVSSDAIPLVGLTGHAGVATGGMGDTLAGIVTAMLAGQAPLRDAAAIGLYFAGLAAERAGRGRGLLPRDVADALPDVLQEDDGEPPTDPPFLHELRPAY